MLASAALALGGCRQAATDAPSHLDAAAAEASIADAVAEEDEVSDAEALPPLDVDRFCQIIELAADEMAAEAKAILSDPNPSLYDARVLWYTSRTADGRDPRVTALLERERISERDRLRFFADGAAVARCRERYEARLATHRDVVARIEAFMAEAASYRTSAQSTCSSLDRLRRPLVTYDVETGNCGRQLAVDGADGVWTEGGCENGAPPFCRGEKLTAKGSARLHAALERLRRAHPSTGDGGVADCSKLTPEAIPLTMGARVRTFTLTEASGRRFLWPLCPGAKLPRTFQDVLDVVE